jgi:HAD superfamily hydrolase (TIGR01509 family)
MRRAILWDNDGVLVDTERLFYRVNRDLFTEHGLELTETAFFDWFLLDNSGGWHLFRERGHSEADIAAIRRERGQRFSALLAAEATLARSGMEDVVSALAPFGAMAVVTSAPREHFELAHRNTSFRRHFQVVVTEEDCRTTKPSPEPYRLAMSKLGFSPAECVAVEDSPRGLLAATAAGIPCVVVKSEFTAHYDFAGAHTVVSTNEELGSVLRDMLRGV